jgi:hypothetical protein
LAEAGSRVRSVRLQPDLTDDRRLTIDDWDW